MHIGARGIMGVALSSDTGNGSGSSNGAVVGDVESGSPADHAGIQQGDTITSVGGKSVSSATDLTNVMNSYHPGNTVTVQWTDTSGTQHHATLKLESGPPA